MGPRYLDMIVTDGVIDTFRARAAVNASIRTLLTGRVLPPSFSRAPPTPHPPAHPSRRDSIVSWSFVADCN